jgi:hypothetical protein
VSGGADESVPCCVPTTSTVKVQSKEKNNSPARVGTIPHHDEIVEDNAVGLNHSSGGCPGWSALIDDIMATQPPHHDLPLSCTAADDNQAASCVSTQKSVKADTASQSEQILLDIFVRRALSAGDEMDSRVDSIRDAIRNSDSSSAWFTRWVLIIQFVPNM